jgi:hypothetical protein
VSATVTLTLAHPLDTRQAERLHAKDAKEYKVGDKIVVPRDDARAIINAGFAAGIDPQDHDQVRAALDAPAPKSAKASS